MPKGIDPRRTETSNRRLDRSRAVQSFSSQLGTAVSPVRGVVCPFFFEKETSPCCIVPFCCSLTRPRQVQRHPARSFRALAVCLGTRGGCFFLCIRQLVCILGGPTFEVDGPVTRAFALVMGLIVLVNLLASSSALAGWATLFIVGASRGLTGPLRRGHPTAWRWQSATPAATPAQAPFDAAAYAATLAPFSDLSCGARRVTSPRRCAVAIHP